MLKHTCHACGQNISPRKERLTKGLVHDLIVLAKFVKQTHRNSIHLQDDLSLTKNQYNNFQKLKYHGVVRKAAQAGEWSITPLGIKFLRGEVNLPDYVLVFNNQIKGYSDLYLSCYDILDTSEFPYYEKSNTVEYTRPNINWNENGQGIFV